MEILAINKNTIIDMILGKMHACTWNPGFELFDMHALDIEVNQHCILVQKIT